MKNNLIIGAFITAALFWTLPLNGQTVFTNLFSFSGTNGLEPEGRLLQAPEGGFYGTARDTSLTKDGNCGFGVHGNGLVYKITKNGEFSIITTFYRANSNAAYPRSGLCMGENGILYGTSVGGGTGKSSHGNGTVFAVTADGQNKVLYSFEGTNGEFPQAGLLKVNKDKFWGTTSGGGVISNKSQNNNASGTLFSITAQGEFKTLYVFNGKDGAIPWSELIGVNDHVAYGTTQRGGLDWLMRHNMTNDFCDNGLGTVFKITAIGKLETIAAFNGYNGNCPMGIALAKDGSIFGITYSGGASNTVSQYEQYDWDPTRGEGTIFKILPNGKLITLVLFEGSNGKKPDSFIRGIDGYFYGTTTSGGAFNKGTIFQMSEKGDFKTLYSFTEDGNNQPNHLQIVQGNDGNLYGTTTRAGKTHCGSIFCLKINH